MIRTICRNYHNLKIRSKLLVIFVAVSIIPILILQLLSIRLNADYMTQKSNAVMTNNLTHISERVKLSMNIYTNLIYQIYSDDEIIEHIITLQDEGSRKAASYNLIYNKLKQYVSSDMGIRCISIICEDGNTINYDLYTGSILDSIWREESDMKQILPYKNSIDKAGVAITPTMRFHEAGKTVNLFHLSRRMFDLHSLNKGAIATIVLSIDDAALRNIYQSEEEQGLIFIMDDDRNVISYPDPFYAGIRLDEKHSISDFVRLTKYLNARQLSENAYRDAGTGWTFYHVYDSNYFYGEIKDAVGMLVLFGILLLGLSLVMLLSMSRGLNRSIHRVVDGMKEVQNGNLDVVVAVDSKDEIGEIGDNFNDMTQRVRDLISEVQTATIHQKNAEIRALEAQINPHFLYNTLDSINWMAIEHDEYEISRMLRNLGVILRYSVNKSNEMVHIYEVADWLEKYVSLHQMRFNHSFEFIIQIDEDARNAKIHKLLFQPFVENAILHGFKEIESGGKLRLDIMVSEDQRELVVIIEDNGKGMQPEQLAIYNIRETAIKEDNRSIGLHNAFARMNMYYGEAAVWKVSSIPGMGTVITLKLPLQREE